MYENKKTAALNPSAPTDGGQLYPKNTTTITENPAKGNQYTEKTEEDRKTWLHKLEQVQDPNYLHMVGMEELMDQTFPVKEPVIDSLLYKGAYLFAGAPKIGKSFLVLQIAYAISTGQPLWDYQVHEGAVLYLALIRRFFVRPVQQLTEAAQSYEGGENKKVFSGVKIHGNDELKTLADAFRMMLVEIEINNMEQQELALREQRLDSELQLANELNVSMLPRALPEREGGYPFAVQGSIRQGQELSCRFYDYFLLDRDQLCILVGEVPGEGVPQVLYTAMAQATIKSQMRSGLPLTEAVTAAGRQLHELSDSLCLHVMVGILNGTTGQFTCINAGLPRPLLMRGEDRYEWIKALSYAPLGQSENVVYQVLELELRQGDRLFFHTEGLDEIAGQDGRTFGEEQLRLTLNERQSRQGDLEVQLRYVSDAGTAYAERSGRIRGYALLGLEYRRRDRAQAHCILTPDAAGNQQLLEFLRGQLSENAVESQRLAEVMVLADELFTLCRRCAAPDSRFLAECAIPAGEDLLVLRLKGDLGGRDPLKGLEGGAACHAVEFLAKHCEQVFFEHGDSVDIVTMVRRIEREAERRQRRGSRGEEGTANADRVSGI